MVHQWFLLEKLSCLNFEQQHDLRRCRCLKILASSMSFSPITYSYLIFIAEVKIEALTFASWFGGSDSSWAPPKDTFALLKNMKAYRTGPATLTSRAEGRVVPMDIGGPVESTIVYEEIEEPEEFEDYE